MRQSSSIAPLFASLALLFAANPAFGQQCKLGWEQCGGNGYTGETCCIAGYECVPDSEWWSACRPHPAGGGCQTQWQQCGGSSWTGSTCCIDGFDCIRQDDLYSQCLECHNEGQQCAGIDFSGNGCCTGEAVCVEVDDTYSECRIPVDTEMSGDPHVKTWSQEWFDYMGECDLKLVHVPNFHGADDLDIHARTRKRHQYSFIETAAIRLGNDTLEVSSFGTYSFNGVEGALVNSGTKLTLRKKNLVSSIGGYPIFQTRVDNKKSIFDIVINKDQNIQISNMKDIVSIKIHGATQEDFGSVVGLMGSFHGQLLARDGVTDLSQDINAFGQEWQVRDDESMLFQTQRAPQYPQKCNLPDATMKEARRLGEGITVEAAEAACAHLKGDTHAFNNCVYDVTVTNDLDQA